MKPLNGGHGLMVRKRHILRAKDMSFFRWSSDIVSIETSALLKKGLRYRSLLKGSPSFAIRLAAMIGLALPNNQLQSPIKPPHD
jgi:hypothetical protein